MRALLCLSNKGLLDWWREENNELEHGNNDLRFIIKAGKEAYSTCRLLVS